MNKLEKVPEAVLKELKVFSFNDQLEGRMARILHTLAEIAEDLQGVIFLEKESLATSIYKLSEYSSEEEIENSFEELSKYVHALTALPAKELNKLKTGLEKRIRKSNVQADDIWVRSLLRQRLEVKFEGDEWTRRHNKEIIYRFKFPLFGEDSTRSMKLILKDQSGGNTSAIQKSALEALREFYEKRNYQVRAVTPNDLSLKKNEEKRGRVGVLILDSRDNNSPLKEKPPTKVLSVVLDYKKNLEPFPGSNNRIREEISFLGGGG